MKVVIFGAAFDPPHLGHLMVIEQVLAKGLADQVWLVPAKSHPFGKPLSSPQHRIAMLTLTKDKCTQAQKVQVQTYELEQDQISYTYHTLQAFSQKYPEHSFSFVMGSDNLARFGEWGGQAVLAQYPFWIYPRTGYALEPLLANMRVMTGVEAVDISSTQVRQKVLAGQPIDHLVLPAVGQYILTHGLYQPDKR